MFYHRNRLIVYGNVKMAQRLTSPVHNVDSFKEDFPVSVYSANGATSCR